MFVPIPRDRRMTSATPRQSPRRCRPTMKFVATKSADQLDLQALHRVRERLVSQRTGVINQIRGFLRSEPPRLLTTPRTFCHPAWYGSSKTWLAIGVGSTSGWSDYRTRSKRSRARMPRFYPKPVAPRPSAGMNPARGPQADLRARLQQKLDTATGCSAANGNPFARSDGHYSNIH